MRRVTVEPLAVLRRAAEFYAVDVRGYDHDLGHPNPSTASVGCLLKACGFPISDASNFYVGDKGLAGIVGALVMLDLRDKDQIAGDVALRWVKLVAAIRVVRGEDAERCAMRVTFGEGVGDHYVEARGPAIGWVKAEDLALTDREFAEVGAADVENALVAVMNGADPAPFPAPSPERSLERLGAALDELDRAGA